MNYSEAKAKALSTLAPQPGQEYWLSAEVLGCAALIRIDEVRDGSILYTVVRTSPPYDLLLNCFIYLKSWWRACSDGYVHADE